VSRPVACTAAALLACAWIADVAAQDNAVLYGRLYPQLAFISVTDATQAGSGVSTLVAAPEGAADERRAELQAANSRFGFRGESALGRGLSVFWQIEQQVSVDAGGSQLASRDTFLGLRGPYGTVRAGLFDTVYKSLGDTLGFMGIGSGNFVSDSDILSRCGIGTSSACSFHLRRGNSIAYESPSLSGFEFQVQLSPDERRSADRDAWLASVGATWTHGPAYVAVAWELHEDFFGGSLNVPDALANHRDPRAHSRDTGLRASVRVDFGRHQVELDVARLAYRESGGADGRFASFVADRAAIAVRSRWTGSLDTQLGYIHAASGKCSLIGGADCSTSGLGGRQLVGGASYRLSRRTQLYAIAAKLWNDASARFSNLENGDAPAGADIVQAAVGIVTSF
jgi:predicted porin